uniref:Uncharacterized protein n=1 Tax=Schistocephalus solidus TaxID=70667 RepID=A0A0X3PJ39_SCHSO
MIYSMINASEPCGQTERPLNVTTHKGTIYPTDPPYSQQITHKVSMTALYPSVEQVCASGGARSMRSNIEFLGIGQHAFRSDTDQNGTLARDSDLSMLYS